MSIEEDTRIIYMNLPLTIKAFTKESDGFYTIVLNENLCYEQNVLSAYHELSHIMNNDFDSGLSANQIEIKSHKGELT